MTLAEKCRELRNYLQISQSKLADLIDTTQTNISFIERGFTPPTSDIAYSATVAIQKLYDVRMKNENFTTEKSS